jgi:hypothetical protein
MKSNRWFKKGVAVASLARFVCLDASSTQCKHRISNTVIQPTGELVFHWHRSIYQSVNRAQGRCPKLVTCSKKPYTPQHPPALYEKMNAAGSAPPDFTRSPIEREDGRILIETRCACGFFAVASAYNNTLIAEQAHIQHGCKSNAQAAKLSP